MCVCIFSVVVRPFVLLFVIGPFCPAIIRVSFDPRNSRFVSPLIEVGTHRRPRVCVCGRRGSKSLADVLAFFDHALVDESVGDFSYPPGQPGGAQASQGVEELESVALGRVWVLGYSLREYVRGRPFTCQAPDQTVSGSITEPSEYDRTVSCPSSFSMHFSSHVPWESVRPFAVPLRRTMSLG